MHVSAPHVAIGEIHRHYKGALYVPLMVVGNSEKREERLVIYISLSHGTSWARPLETEGQDSWADRVKWPDGITRNRFTLEINIRELDKTNMKEAWDRYAKEK